MAGTYVAKQRLVPGKPVDVHEYNEQGQLIGAWRGYYNTRRSTVVLYPDRKHKFAHWPGGIIPGKPREVSDRLVRLEESRGTSKVPSSIKQASESRRNKKMPLEGQERMKF